MSPREEGGTAWEKITYFEYLEKNPHLTRDEAKYWIAWIIIVADLRDRFPEAQRNLKEVVDAHRKTGRTAKDMEAAKGLNGAKIGKRIVRSERKCHQLLIRFYLKQGNEAEARIALADYHTLHHGHPSCRHRSRELEKKLGRQPPVEQP